MLGGRLRFESVRIRTRESRTEEQCDDQHRDWDDEEHEHEEREQLAAEGHRLVGGRGLNLLLSHRRGGVIGGGHDFRRARRCAVNLRAAFNTSRATRRSESDRLARFESLNFLQKHLQA